MNITERTGNDIPGDFSDFSSVQPETKEKFFFPFPFSKIKNNDKYYTNIKI